MPATSLLEAPELAAERIDARARGENFPVVSMLAPRQARPHLRAIYGFARLVDNLGDEAHGDRMVLLDELERELDGPPGTEIMRRVHETIEACSLPLESFRRLIEANRIDQRKIRYASWEEVREYCTYSADPVGRLVLGVYGRAGEEELVRMSDSVCTGLQLVNFLQDPPRDLALGRVYLPQNDLARFGVQDDDLAGPLTDEVAALLAVRRRSCSKPPRGRASTREGAPRTSRDVRRALRARRSRGARRARARRLGRVHRPARSDEMDVRPPCRSGALPPVNTRQAYAETDRITRETARNFAWGIRVLPRPETTGHRRPLRIRTTGRRPRRPGGAGPRRARGLAVRCDEALPAPQDGDAILVALADAMSRYPIPAESLVDLVDGALMDCDRNRYESWDELREYCRRVAGAVGVACAAVYEPSSWEAARPRAQTLGLALQQINIMRDVAEDWTLGRVYLPQDELSRFRVSEEEIASGRPGPGWRPLMEHQAVRADALMRKGLELLPLLDRRSALCVRTFAGIYRGLLVQMRARSYDVFSEAPHLSTVEKMRAVVAL